MMAKRKRSESLTIRLEPQTRFALRLLAQQYRQEQTTIIEERILNEANEMAKSQLGVPLQNLFDEHEGIRLLNLLACPEYRATLEEHSLKEFILAHRAFFYADDDAKIPHRAYVTALWDKVQHYAELWRDERHANYWAAAEAMEATLRKAKIKPPKYG